MFPLAPKKPPDALIIKKCADLNTLISDANEIPHISDL